MKFSKEPIVWIGFAIALLMFISDVMNNRVGVESLDALLVAFGAVIGHQLVTPTKPKHAKDE
jgi:hypothetical protein